MSKFKLPEPIGDETEFTWGPVVAVHRIGPYAIVEYRPGIYENSRHTGAYEPERTRFHPYTRNDDGKWKDTSQSTHTLDVALLVCMAVRKHGWANAGNGRFVTHAARLLHLDEDEREADND